MPTLDELTTYQYELFDNIQSAEKNFKKSPKDRLKRQYIETRLEVLEQQFKDFKSGHRAVLSKASKDRSDAYFIQNKYDEYEEFYIQYKTILLEALEPYLSSKNASSAPVAQTAGNGNGCFDVKLPRINLPTFSGRYEEWQTFYDMFSSLIHKNSSITAVQKLHYLKGNLSGDAQSLLRNFSTTEANYEEAWKQLVRRYNNKRYNCNAVLKTLFAIKKINSESAGAVRHLLDTTSTCLKSLQNMGISTSSWDAIVVFLVISKLDNESMKQWELHLNMLGDELPTWDQLREYLECRFRSLEMIDTNTNAPRTIQPSKSIVKTKVFHTAIENKSVNETNVLECTMCRDNHHIPHCKQFRQLTPRERQDFVQTNRLCFNCLTPAHSVIKCRQPFSCKKCGRRHHTLLHFERKHEESSQDTRAAREVATSTSPSGPPPERSRTSRGDTHITAAFLRGTLQPNSVLLATARLKRLN